MKNLLSDTAPAFGDARAVPFDPALPGMALLQEPVRLLEVLARLLTGWLGPGAHLVDSRVAIRHFFPGKRCSAELALLVSGLLILAWSAAVEAGQIARLQSL